MVKAKNMVLLLPALVAVTATFVCRVALRKRNQRKNKQPKDSGIMDHEVTLPIHSDNGEELLCLATFNKQTGVGNTAPGERNAPSGSKDQLGASESCRPSSGLEKCPSTVSGSGDTPAPSEEGTRDSSPASSGITSAITSSGEGSSQSQDEPSPSEAFRSLPFTAPVPQEMNTFSCVGNEHGSAAFDTTPGADNPTASFSVGSSKNGQSRSRRNRGGRRGGRRGGGGRLVAAGKAGEEGGAEGAEGARGAERGGKKSRRTIAAPNDHL